MDRSRKAAPRRAALASLAGIVGAALAFAASSCALDEMPFDPGEKRVFAGGVEVDGRTLNEGYAAYTRYCYACHGEKGEGNGPSSHGLRPPPRDFTKGIFKFARVGSSDQLPHDEDLKRIVKGGLHGTAMLPWDIPDAELTRIVHYLKTFAPKKWEKKKKSGEPVKTLDPFQPTPDPWIGKEAEAVQLGKELYHFRAECMSCHPAYDTREGLHRMSVAAAQREPDRFKAIASFREDMYQPVAKESPEYGGKLLPPDFLLNPVRSIRPESRALDLYRLISYGVYPVMPAWKDAGLSDSDIWALAHYVGSLLDMKGTPAARALRDSIAGQGPFAVPAAAPAPAPAPTPTPTPGATKPGE